MAPTVTVLNEDIVAALGTSERFPTGSPQFEIFSPFIGHLVEIVGEDRLGKLVELRDLCDVASRYFDWLAANEEFLGKLDSLERAIVKEGYEFLAEQMKGMGENPAPFLAPAGLTAETFLLSDEFGLNDAAKELARSGELTFAKLLTTSPVVFIPES